MQNKLSHLTSILISGILISGWIGCKKETDCCVVIDTNVQLLYKNALGENLINSSAEFDASKIKVYYKNGDEFEYIFNGNLDAPHRARPLQS
jgi:hypothetical protein